PVRGRALTISTTNGTAALRRSLTAAEIVVGSFLNLAAVADFAQQQQRNVLVVCAGWKGRFCLEDTVFGGALAARLKPLGFDVRSSDATLAALHLWEQGRADLPAYLLQSAHVRRLNSLEASKDFDFCLQVDAYADVLPLWRDDRLLRA
ncbi:2-phosphosulfolactate phosphatase, partial [Hymenobacter agri]